MSVWEKFQNVWSWLNTQIDKLVAAVASIDTLIVNIDNVAFDLVDDSLLTNKLFALFRYMLGDTFYVAFLMSAYIAALFMLYKLLMRLWEAINNGLKIDLGSIFIK